MKRRDFLNIALKSGCSLGLIAGTPYAGSKSYASLFGGDGKQAPLKECMFYKKLEELKIECEICPKKCRIADRERGYCGNKENRQGTYYSLVYPYPCAVHTDPIEKKPLFHYLPGTRAFSLAAAGCNIECKFCQNWRIAQFRPEQVESVYLPPVQVHRKAKKQGARSIACTYSEPVVFYEYMHDIAKLWKKTGIKTVMISNGYILKEPMEELCKYLGAVKIDLKAFTEKFYDETCSGELKPVLETLVLLKEKGMWFEIVVLIVSTLNDSPAEIRNMCRWVASSLGRDVPMHFTRFHPTYKIKNLPPTPVSTLEEARSIALSSGIKFPYVGNVPGHPGENTYCPKCNNIIIRRLGFYIREMKMRDGKCPKCGEVIPGVWN